MDTEIFYVLVVAVAVAAVARWRGWPAPLLVTVVALAVSYIPAVPEPEIDGELLLNLVLPPLLYSAALDVSFVNFRRTYADFASLSKGWLQVRRRVVLEERDAGNLNEKVMRELIVAMDAEELALDSRGGLRW